MFQKKVKNLNQVPYNADKLPKILWALYRQGEYLKLAEIAASACTEFSKKLNPEYDCFSELKRCFIRDYRAYKDRGKIITKTSELKKSINSLMEDLKLNSARTASQFHDTARLFYLTANSALRCAVETELSGDPKIATQAREPTQTMSV